MSKRSRRRTPSASRPNSARQRELNTKRRGELAELTFVLKAASLGFGVARPYGDSERYDVILDARDLTSSVGRASVGRAPSPAALPKSKTGNTRKSKAENLLARALPPKTPPSRLFSRSTRRSGASRSSVPPNSSKASIASTLTAAPKDALSLTSPAKSISSPSTSSPKTPGTSSRSAPLSDAPASCSAAAPTADPASTTPTAKPGASSAQPDDYVGIMCGMVMCGQPPSAVRSPN